MARGHSPTSVLAANGMCSLVVSQGSQGLASLANRRAVRPPTMSATSVAVVRGVGTHRRQSATYAGRGGSQKGGRLKQSLKCFASQQEERHIPVNPTFEGPPRFPALGASVTPRTDRRSECMGCVSYGRCISKAVRHPPAGRPSGSSLDPSAKHKG